MVTGNKKPKQSKKPKKVNNLRYAEYYDMQETFDGLYAKAAKGEAFDSLMGLIFSKDNILLAYRNIKGNGRMRCTGPKKNREPPRSIPTPPPMRPSMGRWHSTAPDQQGFG